MSDPIPNGIKHNGLVIPMLVYLHATQINKLKSHFFSQGNLLKHDWVSGQNSYNKNYYKIF